ncbi:MAG TPA: hypothetical protein VHS55_08790 [Solirubrobacteraceae bacterium]|nr:hypothetical protein [Solirubrobacteraceae bacterium]
MTALAFLCALAGSLALSGAPAFALALHKYEAQITEVPTEGPHRELVPLPGQLGISEEPTLTLFEGPDVRIDGGENASTLPTLEPEAGHFPVGFTVSSGGPVIETTTGEQIVCKTVSGKDEIVEGIGGKEGEGKSFSKNVGKVVLTYHECVNSGRTECSNNSEKNAIVTEPLKGMLGTSSQEYRIKPGWS